MMKVSMAEGHVLYCDLCQCQIMDVNDGVGLHRPLQGPQDVADVLVCHRGCKDGSLSKMLLPQRATRALGEVLSQLDEALNR